MSVRRIDTDLLTELADRANELMRLRIELIDALNRNHFVNNHNAVEDLRDELDEQLNILLHAIDNVVLLDQELMGEVQAV